MFLYGIAAGPLYRTESLRAIIGRECLRGNWLYPVLYEQPFLTKPPGHYVAIGLCSLPFGEVSAATARLPSVVAATASVFLVYVLFRRGLGRALGERSALLAALLLPTTVLWLDKVPSAEIDMTLVGWVTASMVALYVALEGQSALAWVLALLCVAAGTLTKWTAPAFFYLTLGSWLLWRGEWRLLFGWRHLLAVTVAVGVCAGWVAAVSLRVGWDTLLDTVRSEAVYRFSPKTAAKGDPWWELLTYPAVVLAAHLPVSLFALLTLRPGFSANWDERGRRLLQLLHCWTWPNLLFWALVPNHNVRYALPLGPGLMGLGVMGLLGTVRCGVGLRVGLRVGLAGFLAVWLVVKVVFVEVVIPQRVAKRNPEPIAAELRERVPPGVPLYLFRLKDEGVLFYYGRPAVRLRTPHELPPGAFAVLTGPEWDDRVSFGHLQLVHWMHDQQGDPLVLVRAP